MRRYSTLAQGAVFCVAATAPAAAQETVTFDIRFSEPVLTPGEAQRIEVWAILDPGVGSPAVWNTNGGVGQAGIVRGIADAQFALVNLSNGATGVFSQLTVNPQLALLLSIPGMPDGRGNVPGITLLQTPLLGFLNMSNPVLLWSCEWTPTDYLPRTVEFTTGVEAGPDVYLDLFPYNSPWAYADTWSALSRNASFQVIPAPGAALQLALGVLALSRRRRRDDGL